MRRAVIVLLVAVLAGEAGLAAQRRTPARRPAPPPPPPPELITEPAMLTCPDLLGQGIKTRRSYCDVLIRRDPAAGILVAMPPHVGPVTITFDLHNRHIYSEEQVKANRAYHRYLALIGLLASDNTLIARTGILSEFRTAANLVDRIAGGVGPGGVKMVAPTGTESVTIEMLEEDTQGPVSILGDRLSVIRVDGNDIFTTVGRPIAVISNVMLRYRPAPPAATTPPRK